MSEIVLSIFTGLFICILGMVILLHHILGKKKFELIDWSMLFCILLYGVGFPLVLIGTYLGMNKPSQEYHILHYNIIDVVYFALLVFTMMLMIYFGWLLVSNKRFVISNNRTSYSFEEKKKQEKYTVTKLVRFAWILFFLSFVTYYLYSMAYGGFGGLLAHTKAIRSGVSEVPNKFSFLKPFGQFALISAYIFYALSIDKKIDKSIKKSSYIGSFISAFLSFYILYSWGGRGVIVFFIFVYILGAVYYKSEKLITFLRKNLKIILIIPVVFVIIDTLWNSSKNSGFLSLVIDTISYPFVAFIVNFHSVTYRWFIDIFYAPFYFLPQTVWSGVFNIETANSLTTSLSQGAKKGEVSGDEIVTGTVGNDLLTFGYMQGDILGVVILGLLFGMILRFIHNKINTIEIDGIRCVLYSYCVAHFAITAMGSADMSQVITSNFGFFISLFLFQIYYKIRF